ncbi:HBL/NHE enterotoxin family protein [Bacillus cereus]|uniref:HBL/NHE enterotoxin family protein n=1 Tax=Bacillus cereus TaxID=1396 RepID=UPI0018CEB910|nr:HBL/NHE enterotoxin family protein [Bacillus cereus]MBG9616693.1 hypothetical protein [Bacillus cereus]
MLSIRKMLSYCLIAICIIISSFVSNPASAELIQGPISTINALTNNLIYIHSTFADKISTARYSGSLSENILSTATVAEFNIWTLAKDWQYKIQPNFQESKTQIIEYNKTTFDNKLKNIQNQIEQNPASKESIRNDLVSLNTDITAFKDNFAELITQIGGFKQSIAQNSQQLQTVNSQIQTAIDGYKLIDAKQKAAPAAVLYSHINTILNNTNGPEPDGYFVPLSMINSLESLNTNLNELDSMLSSLVEEVDHASQLNPTFMKARLQTVIELWKVEIVDKLEKI